MKNLHLLPTDKPSRLGYLTKKGKEVYKDLRLFDRLMPNILDSENQNIYITSDEVIKVEDWFMHSSHGITNIHKAKSVVKESIITTDGNECWIEYCQKIILTTDEQLIKEGVQAIDNEFLKWFIQHKK